MKERPILMQTDMVKAILEERKANTRRTNGLDEVNDRPDIWCFIEEDAIWQFVTQLGSVVNVKCPYGQVGDRLWVRETWAVDRLYNDAKPIRIPANTEIIHKGELDMAFVGKWRPSIFMPRWASRINLEITGVRVERLQDITEEDATAEGIEAIKPSMCCYTNRYCFEVLWDSLNAKRGYGWAVNPWVWVIEFKRN